MVTTAFVGFGLRTALEADDEPTLGAMRGAVPPGMREVAVRPGGRRYAISGGRDGSPSVLMVAGEATASGPLPVLVDALERAMRFHVAVHARTRVFVHAGAVGVAGGAIVIPGRTLSGKSTLTASLIARGATYLSDEFAPIDARGRVHPFLKTLSMRSTPTAVPVRRDASYFGARSADRALPLRAVVVTRWVEGTSWDPVAITEGRGVLALLDNAPATQTRPAVVLSALTAAARGAVVLEGDRGDADEVAAALLERFGLP